MSNLKSIKLALLLLVLFVFLLPSAYAQTTIAVSPSEVLGTPTGGTLTIAIVISNVADLDAWEFTLTYEPTVLTATNTSYAFEGFTGTEWNIKRTPTLDDTVGAVTMGATYFPIPSTGAQGTGTIARITFTVDDGTKSTALHFSDAKLRSVNPDGTFSDIPVTATDGFVGPVPAGYSVELVGRKAWAEAHRFSLTKHGADGSLTLTGRAQSLGSLPVTAVIRFTVLDVDTGIALGDFDTPLLTFTSPTEKLDGSADVPVSALVAFHKYLVSVRTFYDSNGDGTPDRSGVTAKTLSISVVEPPPDFSLTISPMSLRFRLGQSATSTISVTSLFGFTGTVSLTSSITPSTGLSCTLNPTSVTLASGQTQNSTLTCSAETVGDYTVTVTGTSGSLVHSDMVSVTVLPPPAIPLTADPTSLKIIIGDSATSTISVTSLNSFTGTVSLDQSVVPSAGLSCNLNPTSVTLAANETKTSILTCSAAALGDYTVSVTGTSSSLSDQTTVTVRVVERPDFSLTANPDTLRFRVGQSGTSTISATSLFDFTGTVSLTSSISILPGLDCNLNPTSVTLAVNETKTSTLTCTATLAGSYTVTVTGTSGTLVRSVTVAVTVLPPPDYSLTASPGLLTIPRGSTGMSTISVTSVNDFTGTVSLTLSITPSTGLSCSLNPTSVTLSANQTTTSTLACSATALGDYTVTVTGASGSLSRTTTVSVRVVEPPDFSLTASPTSLRFRVGQSATSTISVTSLFGFTGNVSLTSSITPSTGLDCGLSPTSATLAANETKTSILTCTATVTGSYAVTVTGRNDSLVRSIMVSVTVLPPPDFTVTANPTSLSFRVGQSRTSTISVTSVNDFTGTVSLSSSITPSTGLSCNLNPTSVTLAPNETKASSLTCTATTSGTYTVTVTGTSGTLVHSVIVSVTVRGETLARLTIQTRKALE